MQPLTIQIIASAILVALLSTGPATAQLTCDDLEDQEDFVNNDNDDKRLIIFIAGLVDNPWKKFKNTIDKENAPFKSYDLYFYNSPKNKRIRQHVDELTGLVDDCFSKYTEEKILVAHSMGGFIAKRYIIRHYDAEETESNYLPRLIVTYGIPIKVNEVNVSLVRQFGFFVMASFSKFWDEVSQIDRLLSINQSFDELAATICQSLWRRRLVDKKRNQLFEY